MKVTIWIVFIMSVFYMIGCSGSSGNIEKKASNIKTYSYDRDFAVMLSGSCVICHSDGTNGISQIQGVYTQETLLTILENFKDSEHNAGTMERVTKNISYENLELLSKYFSKKE